MKYRKRLLESGVHLLETKSVAGGEKSDPKLRDFTANSLLHTKLFIVDRHFVMIGSLNLDPRSRLLNTELMMVFESPELAEDLVDRIKLKVEGHFWKLGLGENERIVWTDTVDTQSETVKIEPGTTLFDRLKLRLLSLLPIEPQL